MGSKQYIGRSISLLAVFLWLTLAASAQFVTHGTANDWTNGKIGIGSGLLANTLNGQLTMYSNTATVPTISLQNSYPSRGSIFWIKPLGTSLQIGGVGVTVPSLGAINIDTTGKVGVGGGSNASYNLYVTGSAATTTNLNVGTSANVATYLTLGSYLQTASYATLLYGTSKGLTFNRITASTDKGYNSGKLNNYAITTGSGEGNQEIAVYSLGAGKNADLRLVSGSLLVGKATSIKASIDSMGLATFKTLAVNDKMGVGTAASSSVRLNVDGGTAYGGAFFNVSHASGLNDGVTSKTTVSLNTASPYRASLFKAIFDGTTTGYAYNVMRNGAMTSFIESQGTGYFAKSVRIGVTSDWGGQLQLYNGTSNGPASIMLKGGDSAGTGGQGRFWIVSQSNQLQIGGQGGLPTTGAININIYADVSIPKLLTTNIGVGTGSTAPSAQLSIYNGATSSAATMNFQSKGASADNNKFWIVSQNDTLKIGGVGSTTPSKGALNISSTGVVSIGVNKAIGDPAIKFAVNGKVLATSFKILDYGSWPDYVFDKSYSLRSINEVKQYVEANKHLPGMPSAKEVAEKGVDVGDVQAKLLQKVEEMTLYVIKQQELIETQQTRMEQQQVKMEQQQTRMDQLEQEVSKLKKE